MTEFTLIRHGESVHNLKLNTHVGGLSINSPLTPLGHEQSRTRAKQLKDGNAVFDAIFYSPALRTTQTTQEIITSAGFVVHPIADERLFEMDLGAHEGKLRSDVYTPDVIAELDRQGLEGALPGAESIATVQARMMDFVIDTHQRLPDASILVVSHGLAIRSLIGKILNLQKHEILSMQTDNVSVSKIHVINDEAAVTMIGNRVTTRYT